MKCSGRQQATKWSFCQVISVVAPCEVMARTVVLSSTPSSLPAPGHRITGQVVLGQKRGGRGDGKICIATIKACSVSHTCNSIYLSPSNNYL